MSAARRPSPSLRRPFASRWTGRVVIAAIVLALAIGGTVLYRQRAANAASEGFRTVPVERGDIRVAISSTGTLSATSTVTVGSQISGQVIDVLVDYNDAVKQGQVIARIDPKTYQAQIAQGNAQIGSARASLAQAQANLRNAELDFRRKNDLGARQLVARSDVDLARAALDQARAQVASAQAQIDQQGASTESARLNLERTVIRSPVDGVVLTRSIEPGQTVAASLQAPELFKIAEDLAKMKIELAVDEADIGQVKAGQGVSFSVDAFPDRQFRGRVEQVRLSATTTSNVVTYPVVVSVDNADGTLLPGLTVNAEIEVSRRDGVLKVANAALRYKPADNGGAAVPQAAVARGAGGSGNASGARGGGMLDDLARSAGELQLDAAQQAAFDAAVAAVRERQAARQAQAPAQGGSALFGRGGGRGGPPGGGVVMMGGDGGNLQAQLRQRMADRYRQDFAAFRATLDDGKRARWDAALASLLNARRAIVYPLVDGRPQPATVRVGASDGTSTEVSGGGLEEGDLLVTGERSRE